MAQASASPRADRSLKTMDNKEDRELKSTQVFTIDQNADEESCSDLFWKLQKFLKKEMRLWWDIASLKQYLKDERIPRGLRIKKFPSFDVESETFKKQWLEILNEASFKLMGLIVKHEQDSLEHLHGEISKTQDKLKQFKDTSEFVERDHKLNQVLNNLEDEITKTKRSKFIRDKHDYTEGKVYNWDGHNIRQANQSIRQGRKGPILRTNSTPIKEKKKRVSFSDTEGDMSLPSTSSAGSCSESAHRKRKLTDTFSEEGDSKTPKKFESQKSKAKMKKRKE